MTGFSESAVGTCEQHAVADGIVVHRLYRSDSSPTAQRAVLVEFAPGTQWPGLDAHEPGCEDVFVTSGTIHGLTGPGSTHSAGCFVHCERGTSHSPWTDTGASLFVYYPAG